MLLPQATCIAQQIEATVTVNYEAVPTSNKDLLLDFGADIEAYLNNYKWNDQGDMNEKVKCNFDIFVKGVVGENRYSAQMFVGSKRKLYKSEKTSAVLRIFDETWEFTYVRNRGINHNSYTFSDLASVLDFYVYVIIGYDYDTYEKLSGTPYLQRAADVASLGRSSGQKGWLPSKSGYNRVQFIDELNDNKFAPVRVATHIYHFAGLDSLAVNRARGWSNTLKALDIIAKTKAVVDPRNVVIRSFFDTKYLELADTFFSYPNPDVYIKLSNIDPSHQKTYDEYLKKRSGG
ncbi:MAG: hypothetical protein HW412_2347 [Bacteroidetes bacterium]|nr:hypothetical protein [Bacteroidota bacterium]